MLKSTGKRLGRIMEVLRLKTRGNLFVFLFFVVLSTLFWYLNALGKEVETEINYPVRFENLPRDKVLVNELPAHLRLRLEGPGYDLVKQKLSRRKSPITINVLSPGYLSRQTQNDGSSYILTSTLTGTVSRQLKTNYKIMGILPDTLFFQFDELVQKRLPVVSQLQVSPARQYMLKGDIRLVPDSVLVSGPGAILDTLQFVSTENREFSEIDQLLKLEIPLLGIQGLGLSHQKVQVEVPVEQYTEAKLKIPIEVLHSPDTAFLRLFPAQINLQCRVALSDYQKISAGLFRATVDYRQIAGNENKKLTVVLEKKPSFIYNEGFYPASVDYLIEK